jgi:ATP-binding cassette, subfamily G (WHITE), member 2, PDR
VVHPCRRTNTIYVFCLTELLFSLTLMFCGVLAGPSDLLISPHFWARLNVARGFRLLAQIATQIFIYRVPPFTYLIDSMLSVGIANAPAMCSSIEVRHFEPLKGQTCGKYLQAYLASHDGSLANPNATSDCQ